MHNDLTNDSDEISITFLHCPKCVIDRRVIIMLLHLTAWALRWLMRHEEIGHVASDYRSNNLRIISTH